MAATAAVVVRKTIAWKWAVGVISTMAVATGTYTTVVRTHRTRPSSQQIISLPADEIATKTDLPTAKHLDLPPVDVAIRTYVNQPLEAPRVAWVIGGGDEMTPYFNDLSALTKTAVLQMKRDTQSFGVFLATSETPRVRSIDVASTKTYRDTRAMIDNFNPGGPADVREAFTAAARQRPDVMFLVLAKPLDPSELQAMRRQALAVGTTVNVISLGNHARFGASLARATSGTFTSLDAGDLSAWRRHIASANRLKQTERDYDPDL